MRSPNAPLPQKGTNSTTERTVCQICPAACSLRNDQLGKCGARQAQEGHVIDQNYGRITSIALDPIEKKPLAEYMSGSMVLSIGSYGCNLACPFCQNASIACATENSIEWRQTTPEDLVQIARDLEPQGNIGIAYTYNEPLVGFEFVFDTALLVHAANMKNVLVSNGYVNEGPLFKLLPYIDAANIDLKSFDSSFYASIGGNLEDIKRTITHMAETPHCHLEVTTLVVPGINDDPEQMKEMTTWLASLDPNIPYHLTRFFPCHKMANASPTPIGTLYEMANIAQRHLHHVHLGNV